MASNSTQLGCANTSYKYTLSVDWSESETNIANNTTKISANGSLSASNVGFDAMYDSYACHLKLYWHDNNKNTDTLFATSGAFTTCGMGYGTRSVSGSITVTHKSDGSLSGYVKVYFDAPTTSGGWSPGSSSCSTGWTTCTTIARASSISGLSGNQLNSGVSVTIDRKSSSFTHKVEYKFVNSGWTTVSSNTATSCSFTPPLALASQIPSATSGALTVRVTTYNGSTQIGSSVTKSINLSVPSTVVPSISGLTATRIDNGVPSSWGIYVKGISQVKITASGASGSYGSTISGYSISGPGLYTNSSSGTSGQLSSTGTQTYTCTVTDSRGRKASKSVSITVVDYTYPNISMSVERCKSDGTKDASGTYLRVVINYEIASVSGKNSIASKSCSCNGVSNSSFASGTAFVLAANCSIGSHYVVNASIRDALGRTASASAEVSTAYRVLNVNKNKDGVAIGKFSEKSAFEVNMDSYFYGDIYGRKITSGEITTFGGRFDVFTGSTLWVKLGTWDSGYDSSECKITVLTGNGYNAGTNQNTEIEIFIKDSWQSSVSSTNAYGATFIVKYNYDYAITVFVMAQSYHVCDVWVRLPYSYGNGTYLFEGNGHWTHSIDTRPFDSNPTSGVLQSCKEMTADYKGYPIGSIYLSWDNTNPQTFMGGTWVRMAEGRGLFGVGRSTGRNGIAGTVQEHEEFGNWKHTMTVDEMPNHKHAIYIQNTSGNPQVDAPQWTIALPNNWKQYSSATRLFGPSTSEQGGNKPFYIMPPYIGIYVWRRTA